MKNSSTNENWAIIENMIQKEGIASHHLNSYNEFLDHGIQEIIDEVGGIDVETTGTPYPSPPADTTGTPDPSPPAETTGTPDPSPPAETTGSSDSPGLVSAFFLASPIPSIYYIKFIF